MHSLSVYLLAYSKSNERILVKFFGGVGHGPRILVPLGIPDTGFLDPDPEFLEGLFK